MYIFVIIVKIADLFEVLNLWLIFCSDWIFIRSGKEAYFNIFSSAAAFRSRECLPVSTWKRLVREQIYSIDVYTDSYLPSFFVCYCIVFCYLTVSIFLTPFVNFQWPHWESDIVMGRYSYLILSPSSVLLYRWGRGGATQYSI